MYFRLNIGIPELQIVEGPIPFKLMNDGHNVDMVIRATEDDSDSDASTLPYSVACMATAEIKPSKTAAPLIEAIWQDLLPHGFDINKLPHSVREAYEESARLEGYELPLAHLPQSLQDLIDKAYETIYSSISRVIAVLSWRFAQPVPTYQYRRGRMQWSLDGEEWRFSPVNIKVWMGQPPIIFRSNSSKIDERLLNESPLPFARELFREAWSQKYTNPRSALVIGVAALETGVKDLIVELFPQGACVVRHLPSPPIYKILREYFPLLRTDNDRILPPTSEMVKQVRNWIDRRNELSHGKSPDINADDLTDFLKLVSDLLYVCDYARGFDWALDLIQPQTRQALAAS